MKYETAFNTATGNTIDEILQDLWDCLQDEAGSVARERGIADADYDEFCEELYPNNVMEELEKARKEGSVLLTDNGFVEGWFVGSVEFAVAGNSETGWETDMTMAFRLKNGRVVAVFKKFPIGWEIMSVKTIGGVIHWGRFPADWNLKDVAPDEMFPKKPERPTLRRFIDSPYRKDCGDFLYVVKIDDGTPFNSMERAYIGHNRKIAFKTVKEIRRDGLAPAVKVWHISHQDEYDQLPF